MATFALLGLCSSLLLGVELRPGETVSLPFPDLPKTLAGTEAKLLVRLPSGYDSTRDWPVFLWLNGGAGAPGFNTQLAEGHPFILVSLPLFHAPSHPASDPALKDVDGEVIGPAFRTMLAEFDRLVPHVDRRHSILGGFSNGANGIKVLSIKAPDIIQRFGAVLLNDGGVFITTGGGPLIPGPGTDPIFDVSLLKGRRLLGVGAERMAGRGLEDLCTLATQAGAHATFVMMVGKGHSQVNEGEELKQTLRWIGETVRAGIPEAQAAMKAATAAKKWPAAVTAYRDLARYCDPQIATAAQVVADLALIQAASDQAAEKLAAAAKAKDARAVAKDLRTYLAAWQPVVRPATTEQAATLAQAELEKALAVSSVGTRRDKLHKLLVEWRGFAVEAAVQAELDKLAPGKVNAPK